MLRNNIMFAFVLALLLGMAPAGVSRAYMTSPYYGCGWSQPCTYQPGYTSYYSPYQFQFTFQYNTPPPQYNFYGSYYGGYQPIWNSPAYSIYPPGYYSYGPDAYTYYYDYVPY